MSVRTYLLGLAISSVLCWVAFALTLVNTNPTQGGQAALLSFFLSLGCGLVGTLTIIGYYARVYLHRNEVRYGLIRPALRQAFLFTGLFIGLLLLQSGGLLSWWDILLLVVIIGLLELYLRSNARRNAIS